MLHVSEMTIVCQTSYLPPLTETGPDISCQEVGKISYLQWMDFAENIDQQLHSQITYFKLRVSRWFPYYVIITWLELVVYIPHILIG